MAALILLLVLLSLAWTATGLYLLITGITGVVVWKIVVGGFMVASSIFGGASR